MLIAGLLLCIPVMAGGYSASSELKVNIIGICSWPTEPEGINEVSLFDEDELRATPSNASKSNALKTDNFSVNDRLPDKQEESLPCASPSCASRSDAGLWRNEKTDGEMRKQMGLMIKNQVINQKIFLKRFSHTLYYFHIWTGG